MSGSNSNQGWFGVMDRLCGCSYMDAQLCSEQETFRGRSTTIPTSWIKEDSESPISTQRHYPSTITPPDSPQSHQAPSLQQTPSSFNKERFYESSNWKEPSSPTSTATTVTMRTRSIASLDTTKSIARQRTNSSLATVYHPVPGPHSFRRSQTEASTDSFRHYRCPSTESDLFHSKVMISIAFDEDDYSNHMTRNGAHDADTDDNHSEGPSKTMMMLDPTFQRPRALRRVQTDSLTKLPPLAGYTSAERKRR